MRKFWVAAALCVASLGASAASDSFEAGRADSFAVHTDQPLSGHTRFEPSTPTQTPLVVAVVAQVPEPSTYALMLGGICMIGLAVRRRGRSRR